MAPTSVPLDLRSQSPLIRTDWLSSALSNKAFIHSMFCAAAMHMYVLGKASAIDIMHHRAEAVAALSLLLADSNTSLADSNIAAVFSLLCVEESLSSAPYYSPLHAAWEKSTDQRAIHYNGLNRMIALRGGLGSLKTNKCLQSFILWHRTVHAIALCQRADIDLDWVTEQALSPSAHLSHHPGQHNYMAEMCRVIGIEHELLNLVVQLESYAYTVSRWYSKTPSDMCPWALQNAACILECRLLDYLSTISSIAGDSPPRLSPGTPPLQYQRPPSPSSRARIHMLAHTALTTALLTFTICISEPLSRPFYSFHISLISRLRDALQSLSVADFAAAPDVYFWILAVGAFASRGSREDRWFKSTVDGVYDGVRAGHGKIGERGGVEWIVDRAKRCLWVEFVLDMWVKKLVESQSSLR
ncbi:hypothetical protein BDY21DRAFT_155158 [Lineolata rhizophorae]|uniref:Fungal-specific transcription factor domain-containing protein n=1 Tax=Lineolata rhizophorae TaxID=578093 RepID=A0A6A6NLT5_9PEZI|nr:hypothetical protein BDY21DRAFT_155158 [Lineolata rhizophorae]